MKTVEQNAADCGIQFISLMENAGSACARIIKEQISTDNCTTQNICVVSGNGKNGGDGFVVARKLYEAGYSVNVILACGLPRDKESIEMFSKIKTLPINIIRYIFDKTNVEELIMNSEIIVDSVFGTGFNGCPNNELSILFNVINSSHGKVFSIDIPSGIICNTGEILGDKIKATVTIAISSLKPAHILVPGSIYCGELIVADIGISESSFKEIGDGVFYTYNENEVKQKFPVISPFSHKGNFGNVLCVCGSKNMQGAAVLSAKGATYSGAGLVTVAFP
ncbi:MAG: NAD(P)H-hydrate epimerase, partial [Bacteroidota bacterium]